MKHRDPGMKKPPNRPEVGGLESDPGTSPILPVWAIRGQSAHNLAPSPDPTERSADHASVVQSDEAAVARCYTKKTLAQFLELSVKSLDRANALGLLPCPDLIVGRSPRWSPSTVEKWLRTRPRLPGRKGVGHGK
jgi:hypothetical protein